ncbi:hypothetical protein ANCCAN_00469 [Ancylostoma caninum]|uniref:Uncharacterized protein n=1 Tax=Ancylostoma caninum TaxID=29170 RepID=A0A368H9Z6_ANCCA|nr:hypothetical protein ANCCAN_00469 [Ancylostoma caninum]
MDPEERISVDDALTDVDLWYDSSEDLDGEGLGITSDHQHNWKHVFVRCLHHMIGVIIFIRIQWITEQVGLGKFSLISPQFPLHTP